MLYIVGAKLIEVRRKPREASNDFKENTPINNPNKTVTNAPKENPVNVELNENCESEKPAKEKMVNGDSTEIIEIKDGTDAEPPKVQEKKDSKPRTHDARPAEIPKIKVSCVTKKKTPPTKNNPLLKFLKSSAEKSKKAAKRDISSCVDLTLAEEEARDAWKCEKDVKDVNSEHKESSKSQPTEEDCTEDFCLQLEDTLESKTKNQINENEKSGNDKDNTEKTVQKETVIEISDNSNDSTGSSHFSIKKHRKENVERKVPRRVPLITLESPKGKKKQKP